MSDSNSGGIGAIELLQLMFVGFKLAGIINWPWWLVMSPAILVVSIILIFIIIDFIEEGK